MMELREIRDRAHFATFYSERRLATTEDRIDYLTRALKIRASRSDVDDTPDEELAGLEDLVMSHLWEALQ